ncbi:MAG: ABC transporter substrate-binding protein [Betaproteobacteria bacterium]|nr:ABC transporter substrate-binding protein [Betaproteobacteria bacterium]
MDHKKIFDGAGAALSKLGANVEANYERYKYWFRIAPVKDLDLVRSVFAVLGAVAEQIRRDLKKDTPRVAILAEKAAWTEAIVAAAQKNLPAMKMAVAGTWQPSAVAGDVTAELSAIERAGADIVFTILSGPVGVSVGRQMGERNMKAVAFGINVEAQKDEFWSATAGKGQFVSTLDTLAEVEMTPKTVAFVRAFKARFKKAPTYNAATYDAIMMLKDAIEKAGTIDADKLVPVLEKMEYVGAAYTLAFDKRHDPVWAIGKTAGIAVQWQDGKKVPFWPPQIKGMQPFRMPR